MVTIVFSQRFKLSPKILLLLQLSIRIYNFYEFWFSFIITRGKYVIREGKSVTQVWRFAFKSIDIAAGDVPSVFTQKKIALHKRFYESISYMESKALCPICPINRNGNVSYKISRLTSCYSLCAVRCRYQTSLRPVPNLWNFPLSHPVTRV